MLATFAAIRHYTVGSDAPSYTLWFRIPVSSAGYEFNKDVEFGYQLLFKLMLKVFNNYSEYFFLVSCVIIYPVLVTLRRYSNNYLFSFFIYVSFGFYTALFNPVRQMIAVSICFYAMRYIFEKKFFPFVFFVLLSSQFHISALVMLPFYFICNIKLKVEIKCLFAFLFSWVGAAIAIKYLAAGNARYANYTDAMTSNGNGLYTVLLFSIIALCVYILGGNIRKNNPFYALVEQLYLIGVSILIPLVALKTDPSGPQRIISYFSVYLMFVFPLIFKYINNKFITMVFVLFCLIYFVLTTLYFGDIYPYKVNEIYDAF